MAKKLKKPKRATSLDKERKAKPTGYRFKTKDVEGLHKKDGSLTKEGKKLSFKRPSKEEIEKYKKDKDGHYADDKKQIYNETRSDRKHSDDNLKKKFKKGGYVKQTKEGLSLDKQHKALHAGKRESADGNTYYEYRPDHSDKNRTKKLEEGGIGATAAEGEKAPTEITTPVKAKTEKVVEPVVEISVEEMKEKLGREPKYPYDFIDGKKYVKCFLRPYYKSASTQWF